MEAWKRAALLTWLEVQRIKRGVTWRHLASPGVTWARTFPSETRRPLGRALRLKRTGGRSLGREPWFVNRGP